MERRNKSLLFNYAFIVSLLLLALNDHLFKGMFGNYLTGKLSDFAGLVVLPLFLAYIFPKLKARSVFVSAILFAMWKLPFSQPAITALNNIFNFHLGRVADYSDLICLLILPLPYYIIKENKALSMLIIKKIGLHPAFLVLPCAFVLTATSMSSRYYDRYRPETGNIDLRGNNITVKYNTEQLLLKFKQYDIKAVEDTVSLPYRIFDRQVFDSQQKHGLLKDGLTYAQWVKARTAQWRDTLDREFATERRYYMKLYTIKEFTAGNDTLRDLKFYLYPQYGDKKTLVALHGLNVGKDLSDEEIKKKLTRTYRKLLKKYFKDLDND